MHLATERKRFGELCAQIGAPWSPKTVHSRRAIPWDGEVIHGKFREVRGNLVCFDMEDLWHDLAHWLCAEPRFRQYIGFGQGGAPDAREVDDSDGPSSSNATEEEVSALGIMLQWGRSIEDAMKHARSHNWKFSNPSDLWNQIVDPYKVLYTPGFRRAARRLQKADVNVLGSSPYTLPLRGLERA